MWAAIIEIISGLIKAIPIFDRWFTKTTVEKQKEAQEDIDKEMDKIKNEGRP